MVMFWGLVILAGIAAARHVTRSSPPSGNPLRSRPDRRAGPRRTVRPRRHRRARV